MMTTRPRMVNLLQGRHARRLVVLVVLCASPHLNLDAQDGAGARAKRVLALHVVRRDSPGFDDTFRSILRDALADHLDYYSEYIDLNRLADDNYQSALRSYLRTRYVDDGLDLVIASGPAVVEFLNGDPSLFQHEPIVFTTRPGVLGGPHSTGVVSAVDFTSTLSSALAAQPSTRQVFVVSGIAAFDRLYADLFKAQRKPFEGRVAFHGRARSRDRRRPVALVGERCPGDCPDRPSRLARGEGREHSGRCRRQLHPPVRLATTSALGHR